MKRYKLNPPNFSIDPTQTYLLIYINIYTCIKYMYRPLVSKY